MTHELLKIKFVRKVSDLQKDLGNAYVYFALKKINEQQRFFITIEIQHVDFQPVGKVLEIAIRELEDILFDNTQGIPDRDEMKELLESTINQIITQHKGPPALTN
jgi:hypothetical protein